MSKNKSEIVKWEYVTNPFDVLVLPETVKRVHSPLEPSLTPWPQFPHQLCLHLRHCVQGVDEYGAVVKYLYCTRDGRFFTRNKDGWGEVMYCFNPGMQNHKKGSAYPKMRQFGNKLCHACVAYAWLGARPKGMVCDHLDANKLNMHADNLQWVTAAENRRRAKIAKRMRKIGLNPKLLTPTLCKGIYTLPEEMIEPFISTCREIFDKDPSPLSAEAIRLDVAQVLDILKQQLL